MSVVPLPEGDAYPDPNSDAAIGYTDTGLTRLHAIGRRHIAALIQQDTQYKTGIVIDGADVWADSYAVFGSTGGGAHTVLLAHFTTAAERVAWIRDNAAVWLSDPATPE